MECAHRKASEVRVLCACSRDVPECRVARAISAVPFAVWPSIFRVSPHSAGQPSPLSAGSWPEK
eukprot:1981487-Prymnesium_polylepis.1